MQRCTAQPVFTTGGVKVDTFKRQRSTQLRAHLHVTHRDQRTTRECLQNAKLSGRLAMAAQDLHEHSRYLRIEDGWRALAEMQDWLDGVKPPLEGQDEDHPL
jgi:hypothetical protein